MFAIISTILDSAKTTPDTGTAADGWPDVRASETWSIRDQERRRLSFARDYGADRTVRPQFIGHA